MFIQKSLKYLMIGCYSKQNSDLTLVAQEHELWQKIIVTKPLPYKVFFYHNPNYADI